MSWFLQGGVKTILSGFHDILSQTDPSFTGLVLPPIQHTFHRHNPRLTRLFQVRARYHGIFILLILVSSGKRLVQLVQVLFVVFVIGPIKTKPAKHIVIIEQRFATHTLTVRARRQML